MNSEILIQKYLSKTLSRQELIEFNHRLLNDPAFKAEVKFKANSYNQDTADVDSLETPSKFTKPLIAIFSILILVFTTVYFLDKASTEEDLFTQYFTPIENVNLQALKAQHVNDVVYNAFVAYNNAEYLKAINLFDSAIISHPNSEFLLYQGNALLAVNQVDNAILKFKTHLNSSDSLTIKSHWFLALAYIKTEQFDLTEAELQILLESGYGFKSAEAKALMSVLKTLPNPL